MPNLLRVTSPPSSLLSPAMTSSLKSTTAFCRKLKTLLRQLHLRLQSRILVRISQPAPFAWVHQASSVVGVRAKLSTVTPLPGKRNVLDLMNLANHSIGAALVFSKRKDALIMAVTGPTLKHRLALLATTPQLAL